MNLKYYNSLFVSFRLISIYSCSSNERNDQSWPILPKFSSWIPDSPWSLTPNRLVRCPTAWYSSLSQLLSFIYKITWIPTCKSSIILLIFMILSALELETMDLPSETRSRYESSQGQWFRNLIPWENIVVWGRGVCLRSSLWVSSPIFAFFAYHGSIFRSSTSIHFSSLCQLECSSMAV